MLVVADQQCSAFRQPGQGSLHYPAARLSSSGPALCAMILIDRPDVSHIAMSFCYVMSGRVVVPLVEAQVLLKLLGVRTFDHDCLDRCLEQFLIHDIGSGDHHREWSPVALDQDGLLGTVLGAVCGVFPHVLPAESSFAQSTVCCLPAPIYSSELSAFLQQYGPNLLEDPVAAPPLEPAMDRAIVAEMPRKFVPLAPRSEAEDGAVDSRSPVDSRATAMTLGCCRSILPEDRLNPQPKLVVDLPDCIEGPILAFGSVPSVLLLAHNVADGHRWSYTTRYETGWALVLR